MSAVIAQDKRTIGVVLEPLDVLFFRDGRPFNTATRGRTQFPMPQTLAGAIVTALLDREGCDFPSLLIECEMENHGHRLLMPFVTPVG